MINDDRPESKLVTECHKRVYGNADDGVTYRLVGTLKKISAITGKCTTTAGPKKPPKAECSYVNEQTSTSTDQSKRQTDLRRRRHSSDLRADALNKRPPNSLPSPSE